jgi:predicted ATPase
VAEERGPTFVGRRRELETLFDAFDAAEAGRGQLVGLTGEPGIGKSRLLVELRRRLGDRPVTIVVGRCLSYTTAVPYFPMLDILRGVLDVGEGDSIESAQTKVRATLDRLGLEGETSAPVLLHVLGGSAEGIGGSPEALKARVFDVSCSRPSRSSGPSCSSSRTCSGSTPRPASCWHRSRRSFQERESS